MKIIKLIPQGFCFGVSYAYKQTLKIIEENPCKKIYMLGWLVHNKNVVDELEKKGLIVLDDKLKSRYDLVNDIQEENAILILSAHGTAQNVLELAKAKKLQIFDLTCKYVYKTHNLIKEKLKNEYEIIFIGKSNHPETNAILNIDKNINLVTNIDDIEKLNIKTNKLFCTNQTTLGKLFFQNIIDELMSKYPYLEYENDICTATDMRQDAVLKMDSDVDICLIIGDKRSSNCNELFKIAKQKVNDSYIVENLDDLTESMFENKQKCAITAAASTPNYVVESIINWINLRK